MLRCRIRPRQDDESLPTGMRQAVDLSCSSSMRKSLFFLAFTASLAMLASVSGCDRKQAPPASAVVMLDDGTDQTNPGPICVDSTATTVDPGLGELLLSLRVNFGNTADKIAVRALGLYLQKVGGS